jgi:hypothetical protein
MSDTLVQQLEPLVRYDPLRCFPAGGKERDTTKAVTFSSESSLTLCRYHQGILDRSI